MLRFLLLIACCCIPTSFGIQRIVLGPSDTNVRLNGAALLSCRVADQKGSVQWTKDGFGLGTDRAMPLYKRYQMVGRVSEGEYNLEIQNVTVEDSGEYGCQIAWADTNNPSQVSAPAQLVVLAEPIDPKLEGENREAVRANEDSPVRMKCSSKGGRPAARLVWVVSLDREGRRISSYLNNASEILQEIGVSPIRGQRTYEARAVETIEEESNGLFKTTSELDFVPSKEDDSRFITCIAVHSTYDSKFRAVSAGLSVRYKPKVQIQLDENASNLREGGKAVFKCYVDAKPRNELSISWQGYRERLKVIDTQTAVVEGLQMEDHLMQISCLARNSVGTTKATANLTVHFAPRLMSTSQTRVATSGGSVSFHCEAIGNPRPKIYWYRAGSTSSNDILGKGNTLTLDSVDSRHVGAYECIASTNGFPSTKLMHYLHLKGPPIVQIIDPIYTAKHITLRCEVHSKPAPQKIIWYKQGKELDYNANQGRITLNEFSREFGVESKLTIENVKQADYGVYNCSAWNEYGTRGNSVEVVEQTAWIKIKKAAHSYILLVPWFAWLITFGIIFLVILICCLRACCCCGKRSCCCCTRGDYLKPTKFSDCSDVTIRCEPLDHEAQQYFTDMFTTSPPMDSSSELLHKDYISIPQSNPDLDYLPPPVYGAYYHPYNMDYMPNENNGVNPDSTFGSYNSPIGQDICVPVYNTNRNNFPIRQLNVAPLETLPEVATPDDSGLMLSDRTASRVSTHV